MPATNVICLSHIRATLWTMPSFSEVLFIYKYLSLSQESNICLQFPFTLTTLFFTRNNTALTHFQPQTEQRLECRRIVTVVVLQESFLQPCLTCLFVLRDVFQKSGPWATNIVSLKFIWFRHTLILHPLLVWIMSKCPHLSSELWRNTQTPGTLLNARLCVEAFMGFGSSS